MSTPIFRLVCVPAALGGSVDSWAADILSEGELALLVDQAGLAEVNAVAHALDLATVAVMRTEDTAAQQEQTVIAYAGSLPLVWIGEAFSEPARDWARDRGPMTLLVEVDGALPEDERRRITRFVALLGRQAE